MTKTWFITGVSRGFGREWTLGALERGDDVAATARDAAARRWEPVSVATHGRGARPRP